MDNAIKKAIKLLAEKIVDSVTPEEALKFTQAALNLAHTAQVVKAVDITK